MPRWKLNGNIWLSLFLATVSTDNWSIAPVLESEARRKSGFHRIFPMWTWKCPERTSAPLRHASILRNFFDCSIDVSHVYMRLCNYTRLLSAECAVDLAESSNRNKRNIGRVWVIAGHWLLCHPHLPKYSCNHRPAICFPYFSSHATLRPGLETRLV
jgi:hypothetical protein